MCPIYALCAKDAQNIIPTTVIFIKCKSEDFKEEDFNRQFNKYDILQIMQRINFGKEWNFHTVNWKEDEEMLTLVLKYLMET